MAANPNFRRVLLPDGLVHNSVKNADLARCGKPLFESEAFNSGEFGVGVSRRALFHVTNAPLTCMLCIADVWDEGPEHRTHSVFTLR